MRVVTPKYVASMIAHRAQSAPFGLIFDYDGTLTEMAPRPELARIDDETRERLLRLAQRPEYRIALLTGRSLKSVLEVAGPLPGLTFASNGGMCITSGDQEWVNPDASRLEGPLQELARELAPIVERWPGAFIENKRLTFTVHFRLIPDAAVELTAAVKDAVAKTAGQLRVLPGKMSVEVQPNVEWDKGRALSTLLDRWGVGSNAAFFGDDVIDEPAFVALHSRGGITCCVAHEKRETSAELLLASVTEMKETLRLLSGSSSRGPS